MKVRGIAKHWARSTTPRAPEGDVRVIDDIVRVLTCGLSVMGMGPPETKALGRHGNHVSTVKGIAITFKDSPSVSRGVLTVWNRTSTGHDSENEEIRVIAAKINYYAGDCPV